MCVHQSVYLFVNLIFFSLIIFSFLLKSWVKNFTLEMKKMVGSCCRQISKAEGRRNKITMSRVQTIIKRYLRLYIYKGMCYMFMHTHTHTHTHTHIYISLDLHICTHMLLCTCTHIDLLLVNQFIYMYIYIHTNSLISYSHTYLHIPVLIHTGIYIFIHTHKYIYTHTHPSCHLGLKNTLTAPLQRGKTHPVSWVWHLIIWWWVCSTGVLGYVAYPITAITPRSNLAWNDLLGFEVWVKENYLIISYTHNHLAVCKQMINMISNY